MLDENVKNAGALEKFLAEYNFRVLCAKNPKDVRDIASVNPVDLIILDWLSASFDPDPQNYPIWKWKIPA